MVLTQPVLSWGHFYRRDLKKRINFRFQSAPKKFICIYFSSVNDKSTNAECWWSCAKVLPLYWVARARGGNIRYKWMHPEIEWLYLPLCYHDKNDGFFVHLFLAQAFFIACAENPLKYTEKKEEITNMLFFCACRALLSLLMQVEKLRILMLWRWTFKTNVKAYSSTITFIMCLKRRRCKWRQS